MHWFLLALKKYAMFSGRSQRAEYWYFTLFYTLIVLALSFVDGLTGAFSEAYGVGLLSGLFMLAMLLPSLAVTVRRLHDTDRTGWWVLILLAPLIGVIVLIVFLVLDGTSGDNRYGSNPKVAFPSPA
jgi:uncharacterized membrane protein YhaH (DUF805 family)